MRRGGWPPLGQYLPSVLASGIGIGAVAWLGLYGFAWTDYETEALPAVDALRAGHLERFVQLLPSYGGSLALRAPFALLPGLWGGGELAVYRMLAVPCLFAAAALAVWLDAQLRSLGRARLARGVALALCVANPATVWALELGHPEELLGGVLCVAAVLAAARERPVLAGFLLGAAIANKDWALLALGPVALASPSRRALCLIVAGSCAGLVLAPLALFGASSFATAAKGAANAGNVIFQPWQVWWFFGHHGALVHGSFGTPKPGYRIAPGWTGTISHPLILATALPLTALVWRRGADRGGDGRADAAERRSAALLLLALLLLARCLLDTWDTSYYILPFLLALLTWESLRCERPPALTLACTALAWLSFRWLAAQVSADLQSALFLVWSLPLAAGLAAALYARPGWIGSLPGATGLQARLQRVAVTSG